MKFNQFGAMTAILAGFAFMGCSNSPEGDVGSGKSTVDFNLRTPQGVVLTSVSYDLNTSAGADVLAGSIPVPNDNSVINGTLDALTAGSYSLDLSAVGTYNGEAVTCDADAAAFTLTANQNLVLSTPINLVCAISVVTPDDSSRVTFNATVTVQEVQVVRRIVESFGVAPISVIGIPGASAGSCTYPPMGLTVANQNAAVTYSWTTAPDGVLAFTNATNTTGTYTCQSDGTKSVTVTATLSGASASRTVPVTCDSSCINLCGNGTLDAGEECDDALPHCVACEIVPVCGDTLVDAPEVCDPAGTAVPGGTCASDCLSVVPPTGPVCGNSVVEAPEVCDPPGSAVTGGTCSADCLSVVPPTATQWDTCETCIRANTDLGPVQTEFCDSSPLCEPVEACAVNTGCFNPVPAFCYCGGTDVGACEAPAYVPTGPCVDVIRAGAGTDSPPNAEVLQRFFAFEYPLGVGMSLINEANTQCTSACFP